jgi:transglutaminase-like putative cysteine protease
MRNEKVGQYLESTTIINCDNKAVQEKAQEVAKGKEGAIEKAKSLFRYVRDEIKYNPYLPRYLPEHFRASNTLARKEGFCVQKAVLLVALSRAVGIPARLGFAVIRNYLLPEKVAEMLKTNVLPDHGYTELYINGKWIKATPALDIETCQKNRIIPVEFDGKNDAKFHSHTQDGKLHIEYLLDRGPYEDVPLIEIREWLSSVLKPEAKSKILGA